MQMMPREDRPTTKNRTGADRKETTYRYEGPRGQLVRDIVIKDIAGNGVDDEANTQGYQAKHTKAVARVLAYGMRCVIH